VPAGEDRRERHPDQFGLAEDDGVYGVHHEVALLGRVLDLLFGQQLGFLLHAASSFPLSL